MGYIHWCLLLNSFFHSHFNNTSVHFNNLQCVVRHRVSLSSRDHRKWRQQSTWSAFFTNVARCVVICIFLLLYADMWSGVLPSTVRRAKGSAPYSTNNLITFKDLFQQAAKWSGVSPMSVEEPSWALPCSTRALTHPGNSQVIARCKTRLISTEWWNRVV